MTLAMSSLTEIDILGHMLRVKASWACLKARAVQQVLTGSLQELMSEDLKLKTETVVDNWNLDGTDSNGCVTGTDNRVIGTKGCATGTNGCVTVKDCNRCWRLCYRN